MTGAKDSKPGRKRRVTCICVTAARPSPTTRAVRFLDFKEKSDLLVKTMFQNVKIYK